MRNNFDHFDDRLDVWWERSENHNMVDLSFGDLGSAVTGIPQDEMFRSYDPATGQMVFWGRRYDVPAIVHEVQRIEGLALRSSA